MSTASLDVLHVDMDSFYAAVEVLDEPSLAGRPVIVGGTGPRGVVASCSYEARASGVRSAMAMAEARRRCPSAVVIAGRHARYGEVSERLHAVLRSFTPVIEPISLDEAFLDVSGCHRLFGSSYDIGLAIRKAVRSELSLNCSVGIGRSKLIAKLASKEAKPRPSEAGPLPGAGVVLVKVEDELAFLHPRPVRDLWGVGPKTAARLARYGLRTVGELAALRPDDLERLVGVAVGHQLHELAWGRDLRPVVAELPTKSVSHEETFPTDRYDLEGLHREVVRLSDSVGARLRSAGLRGRTVTLKLRYGDFSTITRSQTLTGPLLSAAEIARVASALLESVELASGVRLLGVGVSALEPLDRHGRQLSLLDGDLAPRDRAEPARAEVEVAVDAIRRRYGRAAVGPAAVLEAGRGLRPKDPSERPWG